MKIVDLNVLMHAANTRSRQHAVSSAWLDRALNGNETVGFAWNVLVGFVRLATNPAAFPRAWSSDQACDQVSTWLRASAAVAVEPGIRHLDYLRDLLAQVGTAGNLTNDAHLAALALEHRGTVVSYDRDFERFGVTREEPS